MGAVAPDLPAGIVTFVFTDIEGSTRLLRRLGDRFAPILERHNELLREVWQAHGGFEMGMEGDSFFVTFADSWRAAVACAAAQRALGSEPWPEIEALGVRMGIHAGLASPRNGRYVAPAVHQAARIASAAHGGQVLLSEDAAARIEEQPELGIEPLGRYQVRDFDHAVRLYQLRGDGLANHFPAVRALSAEGHNLVRPATSFFGRADEMARVREHIAGGRLISLEGPVGVGGGGSRSAILTARTVGQRRSRDRGGAAQVRLGHSAARRRRGRSGGLDLPASCRSRHGAEG